MKGKRLAFALLTAIVILALPSVALADAPVPFEAHMQYDVPMMDCGGYWVWQQGIGGFTGLIHYDQDGQVTRTFKHNRWDVRFYSPETGKEFWGMCNILNFYDGPADSTGFKATGVVYHVTAPHYGIIFIGAGQLVFSSIFPDATAILKETGRSPFYGTSNKLCEALAP